jgi:hypothetical protein
LELKKFTFQAVVYTSLLILFSAQGCGTLTTLKNHPMMAQSIKNKTAIQLVQGEIIGSPYFPDGDTVHGGHGQNVDGIPSQSNYVENYHIHAHLTFIVNGKVITIPKGIGIVPPLTGDNNFIHAGKSLYWIHTHDATGIIHMEAPLKRTFTLGNFFDIWGEPLEKGNVAGFSGPLQVFINGKAFAGIPSDIVLKPFDEITLEVGLPVIVPPFYTFPTDL